MSFANLKIGARLVFAFATVLVLLVAVLGLGLNSMGRIQDRMNDIVSDKNVKVAEANNMVDMIRDIAAFASNIVLLTDDTLMQEETKKMAAARAKYGEARAILTKMATSTEEKALLEKLNGLLTIAVPLNNQVIEMRKQSKNAEATEFLMTKAGPALRATIVALDEIIGHEKKLAAKAVEEASADYDSTRNLMSGLGILAVVLGALIAWLITRSITRPINEAVKVAQTVASGDISSRIEVKTTDETGQLIQALKDMNDSLVNIVGQVRTGTEAIASASNQIAAGTLDLSSRTEQQASSLEETASSMEELTSTVKQNADNARQANQLALSASEVAAKGGSVVSHVVDTMASINESSRKIVDIIGVIDGIAFQTNILALNAAVEAARAGEQGRGFAVVASEVRNLAQRSAGAAKEIKTLIGDSVEKVDAGAKLVDQAGATMAEIVESVRRVTDIMGEITAASHEQTAGIEQINQAITQMDQVTQQNASLVEEAAAASESMKDQASKLTQVVSVFKLDSRQAATAAPVPRAGSVQQTNGNLKAIAHIATPKGRKAIAAQHRGRVLRAEGTTDDEWAQF